MIPFGQPAEKVGLSAALYASPLDSLGLRFWLRWRLLFQLWVVTATSACCFRSLASCWGRWGSSSAGCWVSQLVGSSEFCIAALKLMATNRLLPNRKMKSA